MVSITTGSFDDVFAVRLLPLPVAPDAAAAKHIGLLFDTSGSMEGERLASLKKTTELLIHAKPATYALSLVTFHGESEILVEHETDPTRLLAAVAALHASGGTNLQTGILSLKSVEERHSMDTVLLLTDGDITSGVSSVKGIASLLESALPAKPPVHSIGIGAGCNRALLSNIARLTRSLYMYADAVETLPAVVGDVLAGVQAEVGRAATLHFPADLVCLEPGEPSHGCYSIGTLIAEKEQWVLFRLPAHAGEPLISLRYMARGVLCEEPIPTTFASQTVPRVQVACQLARVECAKGFADIQEFMTTRRIPDAYEKARSLLTFLNASLAVGESMVAVLKAQVSELLEQLEEMTSVAATGLAGFAGLAVSPPPLAAAMLSRLASNTVALSNQRGFLSRMMSSDGETHTFSSPTQQATQRSLTASYGGGASPGAQSPPSTQGGSAPLQPQGGSAPLQPQGGSAPLQPQGGSAPLQPQGGSAPLQPPTSAPTDAAAVSAALAPVITPPPHLPPNSLRRC
jgi:hypothetical protein